MRQLIIRLLLITGIFFKVNAQESVSLQGHWNFQTDKDDIGLKEEWYKKVFQDSIKLPASMVENGKGDELSLKTQWTGSIYDSSWFFNPRMAKYRQPGNLKFPFWLTPEKYYVGPAWYQKDVEIPKNWGNKNIILYLERPHWESFLWVDDKPFGMQNSLSVPHQYDISSALIPGKNRITIRMENRTKDINPGPDSHSITDHTQGNWNGIVGRMELIALNNSYIKDVQVYPDILAKSATVIIILNYQGDKAKQIILFGMREIKVIGTRFYINGKETFLRGTVENCVFPLTGYMPMDEASWTRVFRICKSFGLNHMRFHSI